MYDERPDLGPFALYAHVHRPLWVSAAPVAGSLGWDVAWRGIGPSEVPISALRCGFVVFEFDQSADYSGGAVPATSKPPSRTKMPDEVIKASRQREKLAYSRVSYMNAFLAALYSGYSMVQKTAYAVQPPINLDNYFIASMLHGEWKPYNDLRPSLDFTASRHVILELDTLNYAVRVMSACKQALGERYVKLFELIYLACHQYERHQFSSAHAIAWPVVENLIFFMWSRLQSDADVVNGGHTTLNSERRKILNGRDYTTSVVTQFLSMAKHIYDDILQRLDKARKARNAFLHDLASVDSTRAGDAVRLATDLISNLAQVKFTSQLSYAYHL